MIETQPYVKYDTRGQSRYEYSISHAEDGKTDVKVSINDLKNEEFDVQYMSDIFLKKIQDSPVLTHEMRENFYKKAQILVDMLSIEKDREGELENAIKGLNRLQSTQQEIDTLTQQLEEVREENSGKLGQNKDKDQEIE